MPSGAKPTIHPEHSTVQTTIYMPGRVRNQIAEHCAEIGVSMTEWIGVTLRKAVEEARGLPAPPPASAPIPTRVDILRQYLTGETVLEPCGQPYPCERERFDPEFHGSLEFCGHCRIMIN